ncbi:hypothetical protein H2248_011412 [Termitomyces sp. 'cryptogamus']|nr:hypothetical protein H2248_011412 [Termitomyces sp. 'cryptogamus']
MQILANYSSDPPSLNSTVVYDATECGNTGSDGTTQNESADLTYYGPIPVQNNPFAKQMGGGAANVLSWNFHQHVPLTALGSNTPEGCNFAYCHAQTIPSPSQNDISPLASYKAGILVDDFLRGLDDEEALPKTCPALSPVPGLDTSAVLATPPKCSPAPINKNFSDAGKGKPLLLE